MSVIKEKKQRILSTLRPQCKAYSLTGETLQQCSRHTKNGDSDFCGIHSRPTKTQVCKRCSKFYQREVKHAYQWEHGGRVDKDVQEHVKKFFSVPRISRKKKSIQPKCIARTWDSGYGTQCTNVSSHGQFCKSHAKPQTSPCKRCMQYKNIIVTHEQTWNCIGTINTALPSFCEVYQRRVRRPRKPKPDKEKEKEETESSEFDSGTDVSIEFN